VKLSESGDFIDAIKAAKDYFPGLTEQFIEKDYYLTEALRIIASEYPIEIIFKGGTSLSKGWKLIERFSEDIDLALNCNAFSPPLSSESKIDRQLKKIESEVINDSRFRLLSKEAGGRSRREKGISRTAEFNYQEKFSGVAAVKNSILLEMGIRSGSYPTQKVLLSSCLANFLSDNNNQLGCDDEEPFPMLLLAFQRTFVEKLFCIHSKVLDYRSKNKAIGSYARHYYDLYHLAQTPEVQQMLQSSEYLEIVQDCHIINQKYFPTTYLPVEKFSRSEALFPPKDLREHLLKEYEEQCNNLCYGHSHPSWDDVEACFEKFRDQL